MSLGHYQVPVRRHDDAEKPFWISYADLMTALMILFLVIMVAALSSISVKVQEVSTQQKVLAQESSQGFTRAQEIETVCDSLSKEVQKLNNGVRVDCKLNRINFGEVGRFQTDQYKLNPDGERVLGQVVPTILDAANTPLGQKWLKQVVIEGFTDTDGSYLYNLNLSLKRSEWVMCSLLRNDKPTTVSLNPEQRRQVKKLFLAGGVSFNSIQNSKDASRRVELRLQFYGLDQQQEPRPEYESKFEDQAGEKCWI